MGGMFLRRPRLEVANDINGETVTLFRILRRHYPQLMDCLKFRARFNSLGLAASFSPMRESVFRAGTRDPVPCGIRGADCCAGESRARCRQSRARMNRV